MKIYQFLSVKKPGRIKEILRTGKFHFSDWKDLNDPMEGFFRYFPEYHKPEDIEKLVTGKGLFKVACFSRFYTEPLMWSHYADGHKGICVEIDTEDDCDESVFFEPIKYVPLIKNIKDEDSSTLTPEMLLSRKIENWGYEEEIRAFCDNKEKNKQKVGKITKILLGVHADESMVRFRTKKSVTDNLPNNLTVKFTPEEMKLEDFIAKHAKSIPVVKTEMDFDTNKIEIATA